jgi:hypothetical protein
MQKRIDLRRARNPTISKGFSFLHAEKCRNKSPRIPKWNQSEMFHNMPTNAVDSPFSSSVHEA